jgi:DNA-binding LacI/PurR family transcriptional regulator
MAVRSHSRQDSTTLYDVATFAGVSHQTVSRVINNASHVAPPTRARVLAAVSQLGYRRNNAARNLVSQRSSLIGLITFCQDSFGPSHLLISIDSAAMKSGYNTLLASITEPSVQAIQRAADDLRSHGVEGIILNVPTAVDLQRLQEVFRHIPYVATDAGTGNEITMVTTDHEYGACITTEHLLELGHRRIACISGPLDWRCGLLRRDGWSGTLKKNGIPEGPSIVGEWSAKGGFIAAQELIRRCSKKFTAIVTGNDQMALGAMRALSLHGLSVPREVSVTGYDDMPEAAFFNPPLTTVTHDFETAGRTCLEFLLRRIRNPQVPPERLIIKPELVPRESTGKRLSSCGQRKGGSDVSARKGPPRIISGLEPG